MKTPTTLTRWLKFNLVGLLGMAVQLTTLALLNRLFRGHYLLATAIAIELTLLHNFTWHLHYTWPETSGSARNSTQRLPQLLRFHLSNGIVSLAGNLALMALLVRTAHLPILPANLIAIATCSLANFFLSHHWTFAVDKRATTTPVLNRPFRKRIAAVFLTLGFLHVASAQTQAASAPPQQEGHFGTDCAYENLFAGPALATANGVAPSTFTAGATFGQYFARSLGNGITGSPQFELGLVGPLAGGHALDGLFSFNVMLANKLPHRDQFAFLTAGYSRLFVTGNAVNVGIGIDFDFGRDPYNSILRVELRDYYLFTGPQQHVLGLRIGFGKFISD